MTEQSLSPVATQLILVTCKRDWKEIHSSGAYMQVIHLCLTVSWKDSPPPLNEIPAFQLLIIAVSCIWRPLQKLIVLLKSHWTPNIFFKWSIDVTHICLKQLHFVLGIKLILIGLLLKEQPHSAELLADQLKLYFKADVSLAWLRLSEKSNAISKTLLLQL